MLFQTLNPKAPLFETGPVVRPMVLRPPAFDAIRYAAIDCLANDAPIAASQ